MSELVNRLTFNCELKKSPKVKFNSNNYTVNLIKPNDYNSNDIGNNYMN